MSEIQTIDLTPTWSGILPALLAVVDNLGNKPHLSTREAQSLREAKLNLTKMSVTSSKLLYVIWTQHTHVQRLRMLCPRLTWMKSRTS
jgi:hypothetical protein